VLNRKVIAQNITNLSDARYFAAWGVDYLSFNTIPDSDYFLELDKVQEIKDWVEGPLCLIETNALDFNEVADGHVLSNIYNSLPLNKEAFYRIDLDEIRKGLPSGKYILQLDSVETLNSLNAIDPGQTQGIELFLDITNLELAHFDKLGEYGIVIQGGEEEKVGVKSYDELDELYELLMD
jgi:phosphoribosylanthranilate isomerase